MDCDEAGTKIRRVRRQYSRLIYQLVKIQENLNLSIPEQMTKLVLALSHMMNQNEQEFGAKKIPYHISIWDHFFLFIPFFRLIQHIEDNLDSQIGHSKEINDAEPWPNVSLDKLLALIQGIRQALDDLFPEGYAEQFEGPDSARTLTLTLLRRDIDRVKNGVASWEEKLLPLAVDHRFVQKLKQMRSVSELLVDCPDDHCAICQEKELKEDTNFAALDCCQHLFCNSCAEVWLEKCRICPMCRQEVTSTYSSFYISEKFMLKGNETKKEIQQK